VACPSCGEDLTIARSWFNRLLQGWKRHIGKPRIAAYAAGLMSLVLPGAGQVFHGQLLRGAVIFGTCWLILPWIFGVIDAYCSATRSALLHKTRAAGVGSAASTAGVA
jgi:TM2 domain-containing membrane protein YozV